MLKYKKLINKGKKFNIDEWDVHDLAGMVKLYFRELDDPVIPYSMYSSFVEGAQQENHTIIEQLLSMLPTTNAYLLHSLLNHLNNVGACEENLMGPQNLATCFTPSLLKSPNNDMDALLTDILPATSLICELISNFPTWSIHINEAIEEEDISEDEEEMVINDINSVDSVKNMFERNGTLDGRSYSSPDFRNDPDRRHRISQINDHWENLNNSDSPSEKQIKKNRKKEDKEARKRSKNRKQFNKKWKGDSIILPGTPSSPRKCHSAYLFDEQPPQTLQQDFAKKKRTVSKRVFSKLVLRRRTRAKLTADYDRRHRESTVVIKGNVDTVRDSLTKFQEGDLSYNELSVMMGEMVEVVHNRE
eukprot:TRINITY_DN2565_c0_g1_i1.p1 TRINITY_DN2565_c0_g1~~TRINITY_DN2565_c0_g1_i1.p1  ORF type:complete len:360 (-),score=97.26 TRINITY_DN2565_c0_g1_i1:76-1155(-)